MFRVAVSVCFSRRRNSWWRTAWRGAARGPSVGDNGWGFWEWNIEWCGKVCAMEAHHFGRLRWCWQFGFETMRSWTTRKRWGEKRSARWNARLNEDQCGARWTSCRTSGHKTRLHAVSMRKIQGSHKARTMCCCAGCGAPNELKPAHSPWWRSRLNIHCRETASWWHYGQQCARGCVLKHWQGNTRLVKEFEIKECVVSRRCFTHQWVCHSLRNWLQHVVLQISPSISLFQSLLFKNTIIVWSNLLFWQQIMQWHSQSFCLFCFLFVVSILNGFVFQVVEIFLIQLYSDAGVEGNGSDVECDRWCQLIKKIHVKEHEFRLGNLKRICFHQMFVQTMLKMDLDLFWCGGVMTWIDHDSLIDHFPHDRTISLRMKTSSMSQN